MYLHPIFSMKLTKTCIDIFGEHSSNSHISADGPLKFHVNSCWQLEPWMLQYFEGEWRLEAFL